MYYVIIVLFSRIFYAKMCIIYARTRIMTTIAKPHIGKKIERIRILKGIKQETLASGLGLSQSAVSRLEQSAEIDRDKLERIAELLEVTPEMIENFNEDAAINIIANTVNNHDQSAMIFYNPMFNPIEKLLELFEANKSLYERMLETERSKNKLLEEMVISLQKKDT